MSKRPSKHPRSGSGLAAVPSTLFRAKRSLLAILPLSLGVWLPVQAIGLGSVQLGSHLGQPLFLEVPVHGLEGEDRASRCIKADVGSIDGNLLIRGRTQLLTKGETNLLQVRTGQLINEPIITLALAIGCDAPVRRDYQILLDLPGAAEPAVPALFQAVVAMEAAQKQGAEKTAPQKSVNKVSVGVEPETQRSAQAQNQTQKSKSLKDGKGSSRDRDEGASGKTQRKREAGERAGRGPVPYVAPAFAPFSLRLSMTLTLPPEGLMAPMSPVASVTNTTSATPSTPGSTATTATTVVAGSAGAAGLAPPTTAPTPSLSLKTSTGSIPAKGTVAATAVQAESASTALAQDLQSANQSLLRWTQGLGAALLASLGALVWVHRRMQKENKLLAAELEADMDARDHVSDADDLHLAEARMKRQETMRAARPAVQAVPSFQAAPSKTDPANFAGSDSTFEPGSGSAEGQDNVVELAWDGSPTRQPARELPASSFHTQLAEMVSAEEVNDLVQLAETWLALNKPEAVIEILGPMNKVDKPHSPLPWLYLLNAYRQIGDRHNFDDLRARVKQYFNVDVPDWSAREPVDPDAAHVLASYPHISDSILALWNSEGIVQYLESLLPDDRSGNRQGFPLRVYEDILALIHLASDPKRAIDPAGIVPDEVREILHRGDAPETPAPQDTQNNDGGKAQERPAEKMIASIFPELQMEVLEPAPGDFSFVGISRRA
jgi:pilus assembly protein FimV